MHESILAFYAALEQQLWPVASSVIDFARDSETDSFVLDLKAGGGARPAIARSDILSLLPAGSRWTPAIGWSSVVGIPFDAQGSKWVALGIEWVERHATRGAYPRFVAFVLPQKGVTEWLPRLKVASRSLDPGAQETSQSEHGVLRLNVDTPANLPCEHGRILSRAICCYEQRKFLLVRSVLLSEDQCIGLSGTGSSFLVGEVESISRTFSIKASLKLWFWTSRSAT